MIYKILDFITPSHLSILNFKLNKALGDKLYVSLVILAISGFARYSGGTSNSSHGIGFSPSLSHLPYIIQHPLQKEDQLDAGFLFAFLPYTQTVSHQTETIHSDQFHLRDRHECTDIYGNSADLQDCQKMDQID
jgi:hypothetical protein